MSGVATSAGVANDMPGVGGILDIVVPASDVVATIVRGVRRFTQQPSQKITPAQQITKRHTNKMNNPIPIPTIGAALLPRKPRHHKHNIITMLSYAIYHAWIGCKLTTYYNHYRSCIHVQ